MDGVKLRVFVCEGIWTEGKCMQVYVTWEHAAWRYADVRVYRGYVGRSDVDWRCECIIDSGYVDSGYVGIYLYQCIGI